MTFWEIIFFTLGVFLFFAWLMILWTIFSDLFSDDKLSGWFKALWIIGIIFFPFLGALIYIIARGKGMQERKIKQMQDAQQVQEAYIKQVAGSAQKPATEQIAEAKQLLDSGAITQDEFDSIKAKALA